LATSLVAQTSTASKPKKAKAAVTSADVQALKDALASQQAALAQQQQEIQELRDALKQKDQAVQQAQTVATDAAGKADAAQMVATQQQQSVGVLKTDVDDIKTNLLNTAVTIQETQKAMKEPPTALHVKGITITPGGYLSAEFVRRSRALGADVATPFNSVTMPGASQSATSEFFGTGRTSRISLLIQGQMANAKLTGYEEADFLSAGVTSNNNSTNSYTLRQRQAWGQVAFNNGWSFTGGQMWSLVTEQKQGINNLNAKGATNEAVPVTIDTSYNAGFTFARQYGLRLVKSFADNKAAFGVSIENAQATVTTHGNQANFLVGSAGAGGGAYNGAITTCSTTLNSSGSPVTTCTPAANYSFNPSPDVVAKLALDPGFGHYEVFGVFSRFRDRVFPCGDFVAGTTCEGQTAANALGAFNSSKNGGGFGANARWSFANKHVDFGLHAFGGSGVGRYGAGGLADASVRADGTLKLIRSYQGLATLEWHGPKLDLYFNAGSDYASRAADYDALQAKVVGYGSPGFNNLGCYSETLPTTSTGFNPGGLSSCTADTRSIVEETAGFWYRLYDGSKEKVNFGRVQWGMQFSYVDRNTWSDKYGLSPHGLDAMVFSSFRYYLP
jgi:hypothetical protein